MQQEVLKGYTYVRTFSFLEINKNILKSAYVYI